LLGVPLAAILLTAAAVSSTALLVAPAGAAQLGPVDSTIPDGDPGSLRDVIVNDANSGDVVVLQAGATYTLDDCEEGDLDIQTDITIQGNGATIMQTCLDRVIEVDSSFVTIQGTTVRGGRDDDDGAGIQVDGENSELVVIDSTITDNVSCEEGGGIVQDADDNSEVKIIRSTISGNSAPEGGAIDNDEGGTLLILNSTITGNTSSEGAAVAVDNGTAATVVYSTIARNTVGPVNCSFLPENAPEADDSGEDDEVRASQNPPSANLSVEEDDSSLTIFGTVIAEPVNGPNCGDESDDWVPLDETTSLGYNFSDDATCGLANGTDKQTAGSPVLGALAGNGGPTQTLLPGTGSPLIDKIPLASCGATDVFGGEAVVEDQRGVTRPQGPACDIGAVEVVVAPVVVTPTFTG
jgi:hypothetical protein